MKTSTLTTYRKCPRCGGSGSIECLDGPLMRELRQRNRVSLREMARRLNLSPAYLSDVEQGRRFGNASIAKAYDHLGRKRRAQPERGGKYE